MWRRQGAQARGELQARDVRSVGPALVLGRLWRELGIAAVLGEVLEGRKYGFDVERAVFASVIHRLFESGSDRQAVRFLRDVSVPGSDALELHHLYRAMRFLGEEKDRIEEQLFAKNRDLFTDLRLVFFDTTSLYFHGEGGELGAPVCRAGTGRREVEVRHRGKGYVLRPPLRGVAGKVFGAVGVAVPPPVRRTLPPGAKA